MDGEPLLAREDLLRVVADHVVRAGGWQATVLGSLSPAVIVVLDEAYLGAALRRWPQWAGRVADVLRTSILRIRRPGVFVGLHCCDEIPFPLLERIAPDLYSFDAAQGAEAMADDPHVAAFVSGGGRLAWGWIPTRDDLSGVRAEEVADRWWDAAGCVARLAGIEPETLLTRSLVTAACGLGGSSEETCGQSFALAAEVSRRFACRCGKA